MDLNQQIKEIKQSFRLMMDGMVATSMRQKGVDYKLNWGATLPRLKAKADEIQGMIDYGYTFERLASTYTELDSYQVTFARGEYSKEIDEVVFNLDTDEVSTAISADGGYYFFQCLDKYNEELSEANKEVIIEKRRQQVLEDIVKDLEEKNFSNMNTNLWDNIVFTDDVSELTSATFFETLNKYL